MKDIEESDFDLEKTLKARFESEESSFLDDDK